MNRTLAFSAPMALVLSVAGTALPQPPRAQDTSSLPEIRILNPQEPTRPLRAELPEECHAERPPWVVQLGDPAAGGTLRAFIGAHYTMAYDVRPGRSLLTDADALDAASGHCASMDLLRAMNYPAPDALRGRPEYWRSHYYGITSVHRLSHPQTGEPCLLAVLHGENKDRSWSQKWADKNHQSWWFYPNTLLPAPEETPKEYVHAARYFGFVALAWCPISQAGGADLMAHDLGPVVWPEAGYMDAEGKQRCEGVRHPYGFVDSDWFYIFYMDTTDSTIRAGRAPLKSLFDAAAFRLCYQGHFEQPALPAAFQSDRRVAVTQRPGRSDPILLGPPHSSRFQVTRVKGTPYFLGVEHRRLTGKQKDICETWLHLSRDLVQWSEGTLVPGSRGAPYHAELGERCIMVNRDYTSHDQIDPRGFYLVSRNEKARSAIYVRFTQIGLVEPRQSGSARKNYP